MKTKTNYVAPTITPDVEDVSLDDFHEDDMKEYLEAHGYKVFDIEETDEAREYTLDYIDEILRDYQESLDTTILLLQKQHRYDIINKLTQLKEELYSV